MDEWPPDEEGGRMDEWEPAVDGASERREPGDDELVAILEGPPEGERTCTLVPRSADEAELMTQWVSADTGSFVDLEGNR